MTGNRTNQARAVFLALLMVVSVFGATVAFAGGAAAAVTDASLSANIAQSDGTITVSGAQDGGPLYVVTDLDQNGDFNASEDQYYRIADGNIDADAGTYESTFAPSDLGLEDGDVADIYVHSSEPADGDALDSSAGTLTVDDTAPTVDNFSPVDGKQVNDDTQQITVDVTDDVSANGDLSISVKVDNNGNINTYEINPDSANSDGVDYSGGTVTIDPSVDNIPAFQDGSVDVTVTAKDEAGNVGTNSTSFMVRTGQLDASFDVPALTNDVNQTVEVSVSSPVSQINDSKVQLDITGPDGYDQTFKYEDAAYSNDTNTFTVTPDGGDTIPSFATDGTYTVSVSAEDEAGNTQFDGSSSTTFEVDTDKIGATGTTISDSTLNIADVNDDTPETVTVTFDEDVNPAAVEANVRIDGSVVETLSNFQHPLDENDDPITDEAVATLSADTYGAVENGSAIINVTAAQDMAGNGLENPAADASDATFDIDTDGPSVSLGSLPNGGVLSGYVNVSSFIASTDDVTKQTVKVRVGGDSGHTVTIGSPKNYDTRALPDGDHVLAVTVEDDHGNSETATVPFTLDNGDDLTIAQDYLPGWTNVGPMTVGGDVNVTDMFNAPADASVTYDIVGGVTSGPNDLLLTADDNRDEGTVSVTAHYNENPHQVDLNFNPIEVAADSIEANGDQVTVYVSSDTQLSNVDTLNVSVENTDSYYKSASDQLTVDDFESVDSSSVDFTPANDNLFKATTDSLRDGQFDATITKFSDGKQTRTDADSTGSVTVDTEKPTLVDANLVGGMDHGIAVQLTFNEPLASIGGFENFDGAAVDVYDDVTADGDGIVNVTVRKEAQTGTDATINATDVEEAYDGPDTDAEWASDSAATTNPNTAADVMFQIDLSEGLNVVSIPAETGSVALDDLSLDAKGVDSVMAYDGGWTSYDAQASADTDQPLEALVGGQGYIIKANHSASLDMNVQNVPLKDEQALSSTSLNNGWNLVGAYQEGTQGIDQAMAPLPDSADWSVEKGYTGWNVDRMEPGQGYWLFTNADNGMLVPVDYDGMQSEQPTVGEVWMTDSSAGDDDGVASDGETVTIHAKVSDDSLINAVEADISEFNVYRASLTDHDGDGIYTGTATLDFDQSVVTEGKDYHIDVTAIDAQMNVGYGGGMTLKANTAPADLTVDSPSAMTYKQTSDTFDVGYSYTDTSPSSATIVLRDGDGNNATFNVDDSGYAGDNSEKTVTLDLSSPDSTSGSGLVDENTYMIQVVATDAVGLFTSQIDSNGKTLTIDNTQPSVSSVTVTEDGADDTVKAGDTVNVSATVTDATSGVNSVTVDASQLDDGATSLTLDQQSGDTYWTTFTVSSPPNASDGSVSLTVTATDVAGNENTGSDSITLDTTAPSAQSLSGSGSSTLTLTFSEGVYLNGDGTGALSASNFTYNDDSVSSTRTTISSVDHTAGSETVTINLNGDSATTSDSVTITSAYYDKAGNEANNGGGEQLTVS